VRLRFLRIAALELDQAVQWYESRSPDLGVAFRIEVNSAVALIIRFPEAWPVADGVRRCHVRRFPYALIYTIDGNDILVLAVAHLSRRPGYWRDRLRR
jgi:hypothetical protein